MVDAPSTETSKPNGQAPIYVTQSQLARRKGLSRQAVSKAVKSGRIRSVGGKIELVGAERDWWENTDPSQVRLFGDNELPAIVPPAGEVSPPPPKRARGSRGRAHSGAATLVAKRAEREGFQAELAQLELARRRGELIPAATARLAQFNLARTARNSLLAIPAQLALALARTSDPDVCERLVFEEIRKVCDELGQTGTRHG